MMKWAVQEAMFGNEFGHDNFIAALDHRKQNWTPIPYAFWQDTIDLKISDVDPKDVIPFGTRQFASYGKNNGWNVYWNNAYSYVNLLGLGEEFVNYDMVVDTLDDLKVPDTGKIFIRENAGFNIIKGKVISAYAWPEWVEGFKRADEFSKTSPDWHPITGDSLFAVASVKPIYDEYRVWIIGNKVVTSSQYVEQGIIEYTNSDNNDEVNGYAQEIAITLAGSLGWPHTDNYVLDIFRTGRGLQVGEINCMHCSGWYDIDSRKVVDALVDYIG